MQKVLADFTGHKLCFWYGYEYTPHILKYIWSYIDIEITCLKELHVTEKIIRTHRVHDIISIWYVAARKLFVLS